MASSHPKPTLSAKIYAPTFSASQKPIKASRLPRPKDTAVGLPTHRFSIWSPYGGSHIIPCAVNTSSACFGTSKGQEPGSATPEPSGCLNLDLMSSAMRSKVRAELQRKYCATRKYHYYQYIRLSWPVTMVTRSECLSLIVPPC